MLGLRSATVDDDFFALGGDSITAIQLLIRARRSRAAPHLPRRLPAPYGRGARRSRRRTDRRAGHRGGRAARRGSRRPNSPSCQGEHPAGVEELLPLSPLQEGFYFHSLVDGADRDAYVVQQALELSGPVDGETLRRAAQRVLDRHAPLRACFRQRADGRPVQIVAERLELPWREVDLSAQDGGGPASRSPTRSPPTNAPGGFDLARPPLVRCALVRLGEDRSRLLLTFHHIVADGWSLPVLHRELMAVLRRHSAPPLPEVAPYRAYLRRLATAGPRRRPRRPGAPRSPGSTSPRAWSAAPGRRRRPIGPRRCASSCPSRSPPGSPPVPGSTG